MRLEPLTPSATTQTPLYSGPPPARVVWPDAVAYREAIQTPSVSLGESGWKTATIATNKLGLPITYAGRFAVVFKANLASGETWALRCFTSPGADSGLNGQGVGRAMRYRLIVPHAARLPHLFVPFRYVDTGIKLGGQWYPVVAMQWASGTPLGQWVEKNLRQPEKLRRLCGVLSGVLAELEAAQMAHGDWQHDNLLVAPKRRLRDPCGLRRLVRAGTCGYAVAGNRASQLPAPAAHVRVFRAGAGSVRVFGAANGLARVGTPARFMDALLRRRKRRVSKSGLYRPGPLARVPCRARHRRKKPATKRLPIPLLVWKTPARAARAKPCSPALRPLNFRAHPCRPFR